MFLLVVPQLSAEGEATGQKAQVKICVVPKALPKQSILAC